MEMMFMMQSLKKIRKGFFCFWVCLLMAVAGRAADVEVYAEGAINGARLKVYIYADLYINHLIGYGVSLNYDAEELSVLDILQDPDPVPYTDNQTKWYSGRQAAVNRQVPDPGYTFPGEIIIIGGETSSEHPESFAPKGSRALLAVVTFGPASIEFPSDPTLFLSYARDGGGVKAGNHFVRLKNGDIDALDDTEVCFGTVRIARQGDADRDGRFTMEDINFIETNLGNPNAPCYADCNGDGRISSGDIACTESKL